MEPVHASAASCRASVRVATDKGRKATPSAPPGLQDLMAATNAAATIPAAKDYATWEDACRRLAGE